MVANLAIALSRNAFTLIGPNQIESDWKQNLYLQFI